MSRAKLRMFALALAIVAFVALLGVRLFRLQIVSAETLRLDRTRNLHGVEWLHAPRGRILDAGGQVLAEDESQFLLRFVYRDFRREHLLGLLVHADRILRALRNVVEVEGVLPARLVDGDALRYSDAPDRFEAAIAKLLRLPLRALSKQSGLSKPLRSILRFYVFEILRAAPRVRRASAPIARALDAAREGGVARSVGDALEPLWADDAGGGASSELVQALHEQRTDLEELAALLGDKLALVGTNEGTEKAPRRRLGGLFEWLDACDALHDRRTDARLLDYEKELAKEHPGFWSRVWGAVAGADATGASEGAAPEKDAPTLARRLADALMQGRSTRAIESRFELVTALRFRSEYGPVLLRRPVGFADVVALVLGKRERFPGFVVGEELRRRYPVRDIVGQRYRFLGLVQRKVLGDESAVSAPDLQLQYEIEGDDATSGLGLARAQRSALRTQIRNRLMSELRVRTGANDLEFELDAILAGRAGWRALLRDRRGRERFSPSFVAATRGVDVRLTIDARLQDLALEALRQAGADMVAKHGLDSVNALRANFSLVDVHSGDIRVMTWLPTSYYNANYDVDIPDSTNPNARHRWESPPGSILKPIFAVEGLESGAIQKTRFDTCKGRYGEGWARISCDCRGRWQPPSLRKALRHSCNSYFGQLGRVLGFDGLQRAMQRFGLLQGDANRDTTLGLRIHVAGVMPDERRSILQRSIGYGWRTPPLLIARAYAGLATGRLPKLRLVDAVDGVTADLVDPEGLGPLRPDTLPRVRQALIDVPLRDGTARRAGLRGDRVAAKTGTAEVRGKRANNVWFAGYFPHDRPKLAFCITFWAAPRKVHGGDYPAEALAKFLRMLEARPALHRALMGDG